MEHSQKAACQVLNIEQTASNRPVILVPTFTAQSHDDGFTNRIPTRSVPVAKFAGNGDSKSVESIAGGAQCA
jgi:hypothetical protein